MVEWTPSGAQRALGEWEKHTTVSIGLTLTLGLTACLTTYDELHQLLCLDLI